MSEPPYRAPQHLSGASGSQGDPERRRAEENKGLTTEALAAHGGDSFSHLHRRVAASVSRSNCPASSSTAIEGPEEYEELRKKMDEYILHEDYYKSIRGEDGEEPLAVHGSSPRTDLGSYAHSGPPSDRAETASLPRRPRPEYPRACCPTPRAPEVGPTRVEEQLHPRPTYGALDHTAELLAKLLSGSEDPDVTALSESIKAKLGIAEPQPKPELPSLSPGLSTLAEDLKRSRVSREKRAVSPGTSWQRVAFRPNSGGWEDGQTYCPGEHPAGTAGVRPQKSARMGRRICRVPSADWPIPCGCGHQMLTAETLMQKEIFAKTGETDCENLFCLGRGTPEVGENIPSL